MGVGVCAKGQFSQQQQKTLTNSRERDKDFGWSLSFCDGHRKVLGASHTA